MTVKHPMFGAGGSEIQSYYFAEEFAKQGWKVFFLSKKGKDILEGFENDDIILLLYNKSKIPFKTTISVFILLLKYL